MTSCLIRFAAYTITLMTLESLMDKTTGTTRIYEYIADDGTIYWSLKKSAQIVSPPTRLLLQEKKGTIVGQFIAQLRIRALALQKPNGSGSTTVQ